MDSSLDSKIHRHKASLSFAHTENRDPSPSLVSTDMGKRSQEECSFVMNSQLQLDALVHKRHHKHSCPFELSTQKHSLLWVALCQFAVERDSLAEKPGGQRP
jgi:hypothetical protein